MEKKSKKIKALVLFSGGLDSILAVKILEEQGVQVCGLVFVSPFFGSKEAEESAREIGIKLIIRNFSSVYLKMLKNPKYGFGKHMNPCIDCHALMLQIAKEELKKGKFDFLATGEVLGERPMSQNKQALQIIEKETGLQGKILRPLSAGLLLETEMEKDKLIDREKLLSISGRNRKIQLALAKKYKLKKFSTPSGGCLLTEKIFSDNLKELLEKKKNLEINDIELLKVGRKIWEKNHCFVVGRNKDENERLKKISQNDDFLFEACEVPGPIILVRNYLEEKKEWTEKKIKSMLLKYNSKARKFGKISLRQIKK